MDVLLWEENEVQEVPFQAEQILALQLFPVTMKVPHQKILHEPQPFKKQWVRFLLFMSVALVKIHLLKKQVVGEVAQ